MATSSSPAAGPGARDIAWIPGCGLLLAVLLAGPGAALHGQDRVTQDEALRLAFPPPMAVERLTAFLSPEQRDSARVLAGADVEVRQSVVTYYVGRRGGTVVGTAYFDAHRVRTLAEVIMVVVTPGGTVDRVEVLRFDEPPEYRPPAGWLARLRGRALTDGLSLRGSVAPLSGATLTSQAVVRAVRRTLALHAVIRPPGRPEHPQ